MRGSEWRNPYIATALLKQYLLEMPLSVIPPESHEDFILAASMYFPGFLNLKSLESRSMPIIDRILNNAELIIKDLGKGS